MEPSCPFCGIVTQDDDSCFLCGSKVAPVQGDWSQSTTISPASFGNVVASPDTRVNSELSHALVTKLHIDTAPHPPPAHPLQNGTYVTYGHSYDSPSSTPSLAQSASTAATQSPGWPADVQPWLSYGAPVQQSCSSPVDVSAAGLNYPSHVSYQPDVPAMIGQLHSTAMPQCINPALLQSSTRPTTLLQSSTRPTNRGVQRSLRGSSLNSRASSTPGRALITVNRSSTAPALPTRLPCCLGGCVHLIEASVDGIKRHLQSHHSDVYHPSGGSEKLRCCWQDGKSCATEVGYSGIVKHIAVVHLKLKVEPCPYCLSELSRGDALLRHFRRDCKYIPPERRDRYIEQYEARQAKRRGQSHPASWDGGAASPTRNPGSCGWTT